MQFAADCIQQIPEDFGLFHDALIVQAEVDEAVGFLSIVRRHGIPEE
jgi:hypothetical protein